MIDNSQDAGPQPMTNPGVTYHVEGDLDDPSSCVVVIEIFGQVGEPNAVIRINDKEIMAQVGDLLWTAAIDLYQAQTQGLRDLLAFKDQEPVPVDGTLTVEDILSASDVARSEFEFRQEHGYDPRDIIEDEDIDGDDGNN